MPDYSIPQATHIISVRSRWLKDAKGFSLSCPNKSYHELFQEVQEFVEGELSTILHNEVIFSSANADKVSHRIVIISKIENGKSRSLSVVYPMYSSEEIARELQKHLWGGRTEI